MRKDAEHHLVGLDLDATRALAVGGVADGPKQFLPLDGTQAELPLAISLEGRRPEVGRAGAALYRRSPHLVCHDFLAALGGPREWIAGRHRLDAAAALAHVCERLRPLCGRAKGVSLTLPAYLNVQQIELAAVIAGRARLPILGVLPAPLAAAATGYAEQPWAGPAVIVDADDHALTFTAVLADADSLRLVCAQVLPRLGSRAWRERLLAGVAERCIRQSRRDPRDSAAVEQSLYDQIGHALAHWQPGKMVELIAHSGPWYQNLILRSEEFLALCTPLVRAARSGLTPLLSALPAAPGAFLLTAAAARLPGLGAALEELLSKHQDAGEPEPPADFGDSLMEEPAANPLASIHVLPPDATARAAHALAVGWHRGDLPRGWLDAVPLPAPLPLDAGPPRLQFRGQDYPLADAPFLLGSHTGCDLVLETELYPTVSARHCEIVFQRWTYILRDHSRQGTLVNQRPVIHELPLHAGDWVRLGPGGPLLRFLGRAVPHGIFTTTA